MLDDPIEIRSDTGSRQRREFNNLVSNEVVEDFSLRHSPARFRKWSEFTVSNTAIGSISFLALEAIGASIAIKYGFLNAFWGILAASVIIFIMAVPICYKVAQHNIDIDLLTRAAGFGYLGSTATSLIYASFCFIFFALEAAIMAQALFLYTGLPLYAGYVFCSLVIIPIVFYGMTAISRLQIITQPIWLILMVAPFVVIAVKNPEFFDVFSELSQGEEGTGQFSWELFGISLGISLSLIAQIGEQADYLRFMPDKTKGNRFKWWAAVIFAGPGWTILGFLKQIGGIFLAGIVLLGGASLIDAREPIHMYNAAYKYVFDNPEVALFVSFVFVIVSQVKINVTNAYAGSLAWANFFSRTTHTHLGRAVWVLFNIAIAMMLMLMGIFDVLEKILGLYSNVAIAWIAAIFADLVINKPLGLCPPVIEFKRAYLFNVNPVGSISTLVASIISIVAFSGLLGPELQAFSSLIALFTAIVLSPLICYLTKGKYYIAREADEFTSGQHQCGSCGEDHSGPDMALCPMLSGPVCSLCCSVEGHCHDLCKTKEEFNVKEKAVRWVWHLSRRRIEPKKISAVVGFLIVFFGLVLTSGFLLWTSYIVQIEGVEKHFAAQVSNTYTNIFFLLALIMFVGTWLIVLMRESRAVVEMERRKAEEDLARKEAELRIAMDNMPGAMWVVDNDLNLVLANHQYSEIFGDAGGIVQPGTPIEDILRQEAEHGSIGGEGGVEDIVAERIASFRGDEIVSFEDQVTDGREFQLTRRPTDGGFIVSVAVDISARKSAEKRLQSAYDTISSSVNYAAHIQQAILPEENAVASELSDHFVIWEPRDVVGGDIYWMGSWGFGHLIICADCTGHGVPGAFMTLIASAAMEKARETGIPGRVGQLITRTHQLVQVTLKQNTDAGKSDDGLDLGACFIDLELSSLIFSGAHFSLFISDADGVREIKGDKPGIGYRNIPLNQPFTDHAVNLIEGAQYYLTTDGLTDQLGGDPRRTFGKKRFKALLTEIRDLPMAEQKRRIEQALSEYQGGNPRQDDVTVVGFKVG